MAVIKFLSQPEIHVENNIRSLMVDVNVFSADGRELIGFHNTVIVPLETLAALTECADMDAAKAFMAAQIGVVDPRYAPAVIAQAEMALTLQDALISYVDTWPFEVTVGA